MKFSEVKYAKQFIARGLEIHAITPEQVEEVMECEIDLGYPESPHDSNPINVCVWTSSGIVGNMLSYIFSHDTSWRATDSPTPCPDCEALKALVKELEDTLKAHGIETKTEVM